jgi:parallel beta-helix repeat protein
MTECAVRGRLGGTPSDLATSFSPSPSTEGSTIAQNTVQGNADDGIQAQGSALIVGNMAAGNFGSGIRKLDGGVRIEGNNASYDVRGFEITAGGNIILKNTATSNSSGNYSIADGNSYGPLVGVVGVGDISAIAGADHPWANFGY